MENGCANARGIFRRQACAGFALLLRPADAAKNAAAIKGASYFLGVDGVYEAVTSPPSEHSVAFTFVALMSVLIYGNFAWFREQLCIVICPYGRLQGVLYDQDTVNVGYDQKRGEPRGRMRKGEDRAECAADRNSQKMRIGKRVTGDRLQAGANDGHVVLEPGGHVFASESVRRGRGGLPGGSFFGRQVPARLEQPGLDARHAR